MRRASCLLVAALLAGCTPTIVDPPIVPLDPCPASALAEPEAEPVAPQISPDMQMVADAALIYALTGDVAAALIRYRDVDHPAWGRRQAERVRATQAWCQARGS